MLMMTSPLLRYFWFHSINSLAASCSLRSVVCSLQSAVCSLRSAVCKCHTPVLYWPVEQPNTSCEHIKLTFLFNVRFSWVILWSKSIWNKPNVSNLTSVILRWKEHLFRMHSLQRQSVYTTLSYFRTAQKSALRFEPRKLIFYAFLLVQKPHMIA